MTHSPLPWKVDPRLPTAVFDANGQKVAATTGGHTFPPTEIAQARADAALIAGMSQEIQRLRAKADEQTTALDQIKTTAADNLASPGSDLKMTLEFIQHVAEHTLALTSTDSQGAAV